MFCPNCTIQLNPGDLFCGSCGFNLQPTVAQGFYSAPTVVGLNVQAAMTSLANPYHALAPNLTMPNLILNDDQQQVWAKSTSAGQAWYENSGVFHLKVDNHTLAAKSQQMAPIRDFTLQVLIQFRQGQTKRNILVIGGADSKDALRWTMSLMAKNSEGDREVRMGTTDIGTLNLRCPSYEPFLLGIVKQTVGTHGVLHVFTNLALIARLRFNYLDECFLRLRSPECDVTVSHTHIWVP